MVRLSTKRKKKHEIRDVHEVESRVGDDFPVPIPAPYFIHHPHEIFHLNSWRSR